MLMLVLSLRKVGSIRIKIKFYRQILETSIQNSIDIFSAVSEVKYSEARARLPHYSQLIRAIGARNVPLLPQSLATDQ
jgi:hypothetical protein